MNNEIIEKIRNQIEINAPMSYYIIIGILIFIFIIFSMGGKKGNEKYEGYIKKLVPLGLMKN
jgi:hypothetical protein